MAKATGGPGYTPPPTAAVGALAGTGTLAAAGRSPAVSPPSRPASAVQGKYGRPSPACGSPVQRLVYAANEANYCATCQTGGRLLADRALSRLLKDDWPRTLEELEEAKATRLEA